MGKKRAIGEEWIKENQQGVKYLMRKVAKGKIIYAERVSPLKYPDCPRGRPTKRAEAAMVVPGSEENKKKAKSKDHSFNLDIHTMVPHPKFKGAYLQRLKSKEDGSAQV